MGVGNSFSTLSQLLDRWDGGRFDVVEVKPREVGVVSAGAVTVDVDLAVPFGPSFGEDVALSTTIDDGVLSIEVTGRTTLVPPGLDADGLSVAHRESRVRPDGTVLISVSVTVSDRETTGRHSPAPSAIDEWVDGCVVTDGRDGGTGDQQDTPTGPETGDESRPEHARSDPAAPTRTRPDVPPYEDTEYLQQLYDAWDTFEEMADEIEMDITSETVRRYMIDAGVHDPTSYDTDSDETPGLDADTGSDGTDIARSSVDPPTEGDGSPDPTSDTDVDVVVTDGIGLPDGMTVDEFIRTVKQSNTLYDIQQRMGVERAQAREMLEDLNLLDLVVGRLSTQAERSVSRDDVVERLRERATH